MLIILLLVVFDALACVVKVEALTGVLVHEST
jgi:hypothetical protein